MNFRNPNGVAVRCFQGMFQPKVHTPFILPDFPTGKIALFFGSNRPNLVLSVWCAGNGFKPFRRPSAVRQAAIHSFIISTSVSKNIQRSSAIRKSPFI
jgi:hypothetical protein